MRYLPLTSMALGACVACVTNAAFATQYLSQEQAQAVMFPEATSFKPQSLQLSLEQMQQVAALAGVPARSVAWRVVYAYKGEQLLGTIVFDDVIGKFELISYAVAFETDAKIKQVEILAYRESHGYEIRNTNWRKQFIGKTAPVGLSVGQGIANISGATLSCTHVTDGVRRISAIAQVALKK